MAGKITPVDLTNEEKVALYIERQGKATLNAEATQNADGSYGVVEKVTPEPDITITKRFAPDAPVEVSEALPLNNILENYNTTNYIFTLACLTNEEIGQPDRTYRREGFRKTILRSGGGARNKVETAYENEGQLEYFINNIEIDSIILPTNKTRTSNATMISFTVEEPYSMGLFLQTLQIAATNDGENLNYLDACYCLKVEFVGFDENTLEPVKIPTGVRYFPLKFTKVDFRVTTSGSLYEVKCVPWNEQALSDVTQSSKTDLTLTGKTLSEILQTGPNSLASALNTRLLEQEETGQTQKADEVIIIFPKSKTNEGFQFGGQTDDNLGATSRSSKSSNATGMYGRTNQEIWESLGQDPSSEVPEDFDAYLSTVLGYTVRRGSLSESIKQSQIDGNINKIGSSPMWNGKNSTTGHQPYGFAKYQYDAGNKVWNSNGVQIKGDFKNYIFPRGSKIEKIIEELVLVSTYGENLTQAIAESTDGFIDWFRVDTQVYPIPSRKQSASGGRSPKIFVYRVLPYKIHTSNLLAPTKPGIGYDRLKEEAVKSYNYIYTGLNKDILDFEINLNNAFYTGISADGDALSKSNIQGAKNSSKPEEQAVFVSNAGDSQVPSKEQNARQEFEYDYPTGKTGGGPDDTTETRVARSFHEAIVNSQADLLSLNMTIIGDPYYIADSGMGNYNSKPTQYINLNENGSINYEDGEVDVILNFRTPIDYKENGEMEFPEETVPVNAFSGLYRVLQVRHNFADGKFTQEIQLLRRRNQDDSVDKDTATDILSRVQATPEQRKAQAEILARIPDAKTVQQESGSF